MADEMIYQEAMKAIQKGDKTLARDLLTRLIKKEPQNSDYWLWLSTVVETTKERTYCLQEVIRRDPKNMTARQGLILLGVPVQSDQAVENVASPRRNWSTLWLDRLAPPKASLSKGLILPIGGGVLALALIVFGIVSFIKRPQGPTSLLHITTPRPTATYTGLGTAIASGDNSQPTPTPLWLNMAATYTPTPMYVATLHPRTESYSAGMRAFREGEWDKAIEYFRQVIASEPDAADVYYQIAEIYRQQGKFTEALKEINQAINIAPAFAPAYLSRARILQGKNPGNDIEADLLKAVSLDPAFGEAYIDLAVNYLDKENTVAALEALNTAELFLPDSPLIPLHRSEAYLEMGQPELALESAEKAYSMDVVNLGIYRAIGFALQDLGRFNDSLSYLEIYTIYDPTDTEGLYRLSKGYYLKGDYAGAVDLLTDALKLDPLYYDAYLLRGSVRLDMSEASTALTDFSRYLEFKPKSFSANLGIGRAYLFLNNNGEAYRQIEKSSQYAATDEEWAQLHYYRAVVLDLLGYPDAALKDWKALIALPRAVVPTDWWDAAENRISGKLPTASVSLTTATP